MSDTKPNGGPIADRPGTYGRWLQLAVVFGVILLTAVGIGSALTKETAESAVVASSGTRVSSSSEARRASDPTLENRPSTQVMLPDFATLAQNTLPAVVTVTSTVVRTMPARDQGNPFDFFNRNQPRRPGREEPEEFRQRGGGTGFIIDAEGWIITNHHVIDEAQEVIVRLGDRDYPAEVKGRDAATDLALLKIKADHLPTLSLGSSQDLRVGEWVMAVGNPLGLDHSVTVGVVSAKGRQLGLSDFSLENYIQTDAAINQGNSGGPLLNLQGQVVGINTAMNFGAENIGFAVPVDTLKRILPQLRKTGSVSRGYLGVNIGEIDARTAEAFGLASSDGALVARVEADTPAGKAGVERGDVILRVDDIEVKETRDLIDYVSAKSPGDRVTLALLRGSDHKKLDVKLGERPGTRAAAAEEKDEATGLDWLGIDVQTLDRQTRMRLGADDDLRGVLVTDVHGTSPLSDEGVRPGDVITELNGQKISNAEDLQKAIESRKAGDWLRFYVERFNPNTKQSNGFFALTQVPGSER